MTRRRFCAPRSAFNFTKHTVTLTADEARHLREVLRLKPGDEVSVFDGEGKEYRARVVQARREFAELELAEEIATARPESPLQLTLAVALLKGEKFDFVVQKATELGVHKIVPLITRYADIKLRDESDASKRVTRWQRIALEAAKQSGRAVVPKVENPTPFAAVLSPSNPCLLFSERGGHGLTRIENPITAIIGSEGGWSDEELEQARAAGAQIVTLGGRILRAETAAITAAALLQHRFGDLEW
ncbi:MAG TPA: 16S rRNA (uracil(1498)-N(3))-methyltransferase [Pyrinomonadaceae bacterium]|nr:16S rRNA (uracil(1498)-N(3))-methyltransferase [Pyrinomonadaceae bacterium]